MTAHLLPNPESNLEWPVRIAQIVPQTRAEGPGERFAIWFQGCPFRCLGCCNPEMLSDQGGRESAVAAVLSQLDRAMETASDLEGITLLGGEPFAQAGAAAVIAMHARQRGLSVMIFSGYRLEELEKSPDFQIQELLRHADLLVDGLYERDQPDSRRRWIGSQNQEIHFLTNRYSKHDACWREPETLEIRLEDRQLTINGFPAKSAMGLWKRVDARS